MNTEIAIYLGDNGRCTCPKHTGHSILVYLRDVSGEDALAFTRAEADFHGLSCEDCEGEA